MCSVISQREQGQESTLDFGAPPPSRQGAAAAGRVLDSGRNSTGEVAVHILGALVHQQTPDTGPCQFNTSFRPEFPLNGACVSLSSLHGAMFEPSRASILLVSETQSSYFMLSLDILAGLSHPLCLMVDLQDYLELYIITLPELRRFKVIRGLLSTL